MINTLAQTQWGGLAERVAGMGKVEKDFFLIDNARIENIALELAWLQDEKVLRELGLSSIHTPVLMCVLANPLLEDPDTKMGVLIQMTTNPDIPWGVLDFITTDTGLAGLDVMQREVILTYALDNKNMPVSRAIELRNVMI